MAENKSAGSAANQSLEEDFYSLLNLDKNATEYEITNAYRKLSKLYHPDKHTDPNKKEHAEILFGRIKMAYEVLGDPHKRAIYDTVGMKGIETEGWMIVQRTKTPQEIREEYEQLAKEKEERRLQQQTNPKGTLIVNINATELFEPYDNQINLSGIEISSMSISQSVDASVNSSNTLSLHGNLTSQNGTGSGSVACNIRKIVSSKSWLEYGIGGGNGLLFTLKGFRHFSNKCFGSLQSGFQVTPMGIVPTFQTVLGQQLTKEVGGYLTYSAGNNSSVKTTLVWQSKNKHHLTTDLQFGLRSNFIAISYRHLFSEDTKLLTSLKISTSGLQLEYGCEKKVFKTNWVKASVQLSVPSGVTLKLRVTYANQTLVFPITLAEDILPSAVFYGTVAPILGWYMFKAIIIDPYNERQKEKLMEENIAKLSERRKEAKMAVNLMQEAYSRIKELEENKRGLVIVQAWYGNPGNLPSEDDLMTREDVLDVTVQLQCLVKNSRLILPEKSKCNLPGFYDPCLGEDKYLVVKYIFRNRAHSITIKDDEVLRIPIER